MNRFDRDTALRAGPAGVLEGEIDPGWWIAAGPNGGYLSALLLRGMIATHGHDDRPPRSFTAHFLSRASAGPAQVRAELQRDGRSLSTVTARLEQQGKLIALAIGAFSQPRDGLVFSELSMPDVPAPEDVPATADENVAAPFRQRWEYRPCLGGGPMSGSELALAGGWIRPAEPREADLLQVAALCDSWPPALLARLPEDSDFQGMPTIDLTVHVRNSLPEKVREPGAFLLGAYRSRVAADGYSEEEAEIWSRDGRLLAQSRQLAIFA